MGSGWMIGVMVELPGEPKPLRHFFAVGHEDRAKAEWTAIDRAMLIGGVVVTESVFNLPGLGRLVVEAVLARDYPVIQGLILLFALVYVLINLLVDVSYTIFDPRIRY